MRTLVALPLAVPLLVAAILVGASPLLRRHRQTRDLMVTLTMAGTTAIAALLIWRSQAAPFVYWFGGWLPRDGKALGIAFQINPIGAGLATMAALLTTAALVYSWHYFEEIRGLFHALLLTFAAGMIGFALTGDLFNMFVFFELMGVAAFGLTCYKREAPTLEGALNFAVTNSIGAFLILLGIALLYARTSALNMAEVGAVLVEQATGAAAAGAMGAATSAGATLAGAVGAAVPGGAPVARPDGLILVAAALIFTGFLVKAAAVPFHFWLPDAHAVAPTPVCILFSGIMVELGIYAIARIYWTSFSGVISPEAGLRPILVGFGTATAVLGALMCFLQRHLKRLLAFSTISHSGVILIGVGLLTPEALSGAILYLFGHGLIKAALFLAVGILLHRTGSVDEFELFGRCHHLPSTGVLFALGGLALAGVPPFGLFTGKSLMEHAGDEAGYIWVAWIALLASLVTGGAVLRAAGRIFLGLGKPEGLEEEAPVETPGQEIHGAEGRTPAVMIGPIVALLTLALLIGVLPWIPGFYEAAAERFQERSLIADVVLHGAIAPPLAGRTSGPEVYTTSSVLYAVGATVGAILLALASLFYDFSDIPGPLGRAVDAGNRALEAFHSGHVGDYVAWITVGVALLGGLFGLVLRS
jgi:multicomponent Na+:H+ antiporter subunit D